MLKLYLWIIGLAKNHVELRAISFCRYTLLRSIFECPVLTWWSTNETSLCQATANKNPNMVILHSTDCFSHMLSTIIRSCGIRSLLTFEMQTIGKGKRIIFGSNCIISCQFQIIKLASTHGPHDGLYGLDGHGLATQKPTWAPRGQSIGNSGVSP